MSYGAITTSTAYSSQYAPRVQCVYQGMDGFHSWLYRSTHTHVECEVNGFFTSGRREGMIIGDEITIINYSTGGSSAATIHSVIGSTGAVAATESASSAYRQGYNVSISGMTTS